MLFRKTEPEAPKSKSRATRCAPLLKRRNFPEVAAQVARKEPGAALGQAGPGGCPNTA